MRRRAGLCAALLLAGCAPQAARLPAAPVAAGPTIRVVAAPVAENEPGYESLCLDTVPKSPGAPVLPCDRWRFAGGLHLSSTDTSRLHGLSDLVVTSDGRFIAVSDEGDLVRGRLVLDASDRLAGLADVTLAPLTGLEGTSLSGSKVDSDAEGLALWPNGDLMVSFEATHRIWLYPVAGGAPRSLPFPASPFPGNDGMEALALDPESGRDAYLVGREDTRETWTCRLGGPCAPSFRVAGPPGGLVAARALPGGRWTFVLRDFNPLVGNTIQLLVTDRAGRKLDSYEIKRPATVDNFEGVAVLPRADGSVRFYLLSDDNFSRGQRTLLLAFDWTPPARR